MTFDSTLFEPTQVCLEIDPAVQTQAWQQSQHFATPTSRWTAYLNQLCLWTVLPWFQEDHQAALTTRSVALESIWEVVTGTAIAIGNQRLLLLPTEAIDLDELRVPQEWVDLPNWLADYYLTVQVNSDEGWVRLAGFTTHHQLKTVGVYDWRDRTYALEETALVTDLNVLWVAQQLQLAEPTRANIGAIAPLPLTQATNLLQRLGNAEILNPRLELPFEVWAGLMQHSGWRQRLTEVRRGLPEQRSVMRWLQAGVANLSQPWGWGQIEFQPSFASARGEGDTDRSVGLAHPLSIAGQPYELRILPLATDDGRIWRFELQNLSPGGRIPVGFVLRLLTEDLQPFENNEDIATTVVDQLFVEVALTPGEGLIWEIEPTPDYYEQEILRF
jgi:hypothetical protein